MVAVFCFHSFSQDDDVSCNGSIVHKTERKESLGMLCHTRQDGTCREGHARYAEARGCVVWAISDITSLQFD